MKIQLSDHFDFKRMLRFTLPSILMLIFTSIYGVVDGFFVSNFVGKTSFAAVNLIMPVLMILGAVGFMFGTGGGALIAKTMGQGEEDKAKRLFSLFVSAIIVCGVIIGVLGFVFLRPIAVRLGAEGQMLRDCVLYGRIFLVGLPLYMLQFGFQPFFITAEKPQLGLLITVLSGVTNMVLDALFILGFQWGLAGAAIATVCGQAVGGIVPLIYFSRPNTSRLRLVKPRFDGRALVRACTNGASELMGNVSTSVVSMLYNMQLMRYAGENGIAAYGVLMYVSLVFLAVFLGYSTGIAPVISYQYGAGHTAEVRSILKKSILLIGIFAVGMVAFSEFCAYPLSYLFVGYDSELMRLTLRGFFIYSFSFLFAGFSIFGSAFFTALNDGLTSALISFLRSLVFQVAAILILPVLWKTDGIWSAIVVAEVMAFLTTIFFFKRKQKQYLSPNEDK